MCEVAPPVLGVGQLMRSGHFPQRRMLESQGAIRLHQANANVAGLVVLDSISHSVLDAICCHGSRLICEDCFFQTSSPCLDAIHGGIEQRMYELGMLKL